MRERRFRLPAAAAVFALGFCACAPEELPKGKLLYAEAPLSGDGLDATVSFGATAARTGVKVTFANLGEGTAQLTRAEFVDGDRVQFDDGGPATPFTFVWPGAVQISPGARFSFDAFFDPSRPMNREAQARVKLTVENAQADSALLTLAGHRLEGSCGSSQAGLDFGVVPVGSSVTLPWKVVNPLSEPLHVQLTSIAFGAPVGAKDSPFQLDPPLPVAFDLEAFGSRELSLTFAAKAPIGATASVQLERTPFCPPIVVNFFGSAM